MKSMQMQCIIWNFTLNCSAVCHCLIFLNYSFIDSYYKENLNNKQFSFFKKYCNTLHDTWILFIFNYSFINSFYKERFINKFIKILFCFTVKKQTNILLIKSSKSAYQELRRQLRKALFIFLSSCI